MFFLLYVHCFLVCFFLPNALQFKLLHIESNNYLWFHHAIFVLIIPSFVSAYNPPYIVVFLFG